MLVILGGLPGVGKSSIARGLAGALPAVHVRIDSIEQALREWTASGPLDDAGYRVGYAVAEDNLRLGHSVVADSVNPIAITRKAWRDVARRASRAAIEVEIRCSDVEEHRQRVDRRRVGDDAGPSWSEIVGRRYESWNADLVVDTSGRSIDEIVAGLIALVRSRGAPRR